MALKQIQFLLRWKIFIKGRIHERRGYSVSKDDKFVLDYM